MIGSRFYNYSGTSRSGNAFLFFIENSTWVNLLSTAGAPIATENGGFGWSVAINNDYALIGASGYDYTTTDPMTMTSTTTTDSGNAFLYELANADGDSTSNEWTDLLSTMGAPAPQTNAGFGSAVALSTPVALSETHAVIGASNYSFPITDLTNIAGSGNAFLYNVSTSTWVGPTDASGRSRGLLATPRAPTPRINSAFGSAVAISPSHVLVGASGYDFPVNSETTLTNSGNAFLYTIMSGNWVDLLADPSADAPAAQPNFNFGNSVALSSRYALIGASNANYLGTVASGIAYLYALSDGAWTNLLGTSGAPTAQTGANFGVSVALSATHALVGAGNYTYRSIGRSGNAFLHNITNGGWTDILGTPGAATPQANAGFGTAVALSSRNILIGAPSHNYSSAGVGSGNAYLLTLAPSPTAPSFDAIIFSNDILVDLTFNNPVYRASNSITVYGSLNLTRIFGRLTLIAPSISFYQTDANSVIGGDDDGRGVGGVNAIVLTRPTGTWTAQSLTLPANGTSYFSTSTPGILNSILDSTRGTLNLTQDTGDITFSQNLTAIHLDLILNAPAGAINLETYTLTVNRFDATAMSDITARTRAVTQTFTGDSLNTGGTIAAPTIRLRATTGSIGSGAERVRVRAATTTFNSFLAAANTDVYLSTNSPVWFAYINVAGRMTGSGTLSVISDVIPEPAQAAGLLSFALDPILELLGSGCAKEDFLVDVVGAFTFLCGSDQ